MCCAWYCLSHTGNNYGGEDPSGVCAVETETEGIDRKSLILPGRQLELLQRVAATGTPVVLAMINAGPVDISWAKAHIPAIVWGGYGGQSGGQALVDVLVGTVNPGGALPYTVYPQTFADMASFSDMGMRPNKTTGNPGRSYRFLDTSQVEPLWPFGWGGSYSSGFTVAWAQVPPGESGESGESGEGGESRGSGGSGGGGGRVGSGGSVVGLGETTTWTVQVSNAAENAGGVAVSIHRRDE